MPSARARIVNAAYRAYLKPRLEGERDLDQMRGYLDRLAPLVGGPPRGTEIETVVLRSCEADLITPPDASGTRRLLYLPGGGFVLRSPAVHRALVGRIAREAETPALLTHYRLAPEHPFPAALEDCVAAYEYLLDSGIRPSRIVLGGDSAGGCLVLGTMMILRDRGIELPAGAFLLSPVTDLRGHRNGSRTENAESDSMLTMDASEDLHRHYVGEVEEELSNPLVSPVLGDLSELPPLLFHASAAEILLDDTLVTAERARAAGVSCRTEIFEGMPHVWHAIPQLPESKRALAALGEFMRQAVDDARANQEMEQTCTTPT